MEEELIVEESGLETMQVTEITETPYMPFTYEDAGEWASAPVIIGLFLGLILTVCRAALLKRGVFDKY